MLSSASLTWCMLHIHLPSLSCSNVISPRYHSRKFKRRLELKKAARMTAIPQLELPNILVDDEEERAKQLKQKKKPTTLSPHFGGGAIAPSSFSPDTPSPGTTTFLSPTRNSGGSTHQKTFSSSSAADLTSLQMPPLHEGSGQHPLSAPQGGGAGGRGPDAHQSTHSAFSFELQEPTSGQNSRQNSNRNSRSNSAVSPSQMSQILDDSIWMDSIRRSATMKRNKPGW